MVKKERLVVIGGDAAGMSAAAKVRRERPEVEIVVFERSPHTSYSACGMPYYIAGMVATAEELIARTPQQFREKYSIDARVRHEVLSIDPSGCRVRVRGDGGEEFWEGYDQLLIATGAHPFCPPLPGADARGIFGLSTLESGIRVRQALEAENPQRAVVVGGGYIGLEMAEAMIRRNLHVSLVTRGTEVMETLDPDMGALVSEALQDVGVTLYRGEALTGFEKNREGKVTAVVTDRRTLPTDIVILGMGVRANSRLAQEAGIALGVKGAIRVNERMQTEVAGIWAAGDCVASHHLVSRRPFYIALGTVANKQGVIAGTNLAGGYATFPGVLGTAVSKVCRYEVARTGLHEADIGEVGLEYVSATIRSRTRAGYYPGAGRITVKVLAEKGSGRLLGGQIVGEEGAAKRIDVLATALHAGMTVHDVVNLDLSYAPPYSPVWDPVQTAARQAMKDV